MTDERQLIEAAFRQEAGPPASSRPSAPPAEQLGALLTASDEIPGYNIDAEIHHGGQGVVYRAVQKATQRTVAIKVMREGPFACAADRARFEREIQILAALNHPNIITILDSGVARGNFYYVMSYVPGEPLDQYVARNAPGIEDTLRLFVAIGEAVNAAHLQGVIHRDLKPGNIRVDAEGRPFVLDFGLARRTLQAGTGEAAPQTMTLTGQFVGSLPWASPEQAEGKPSKIDTRTDVYSLGVMLYAMLTGRFPYAVVGNMRDVLDNILNAQPPKPHSLRRQINDELETIILKCLAKERERRYQTAGELARDIKRFLRGQPLEAKRDSTLYVLRKTLRRHRTPLAAILAAVLVLPACVFYVHGQRKLAEERQREVHRERLVQHLTVERSAPRRAHWSARAWELAAGIAAIRADDAARSLAASTMMGLDVRTIGESQSQSTSALAFSFDGQQLLLGGTDDTPDRAGCSAALWHFASGSPSTVGQRGAGPVTFSADGTALQLLARPDGLLLWDVARQQPVRELRMPRPIGPAAASGQARSPTLSADGTLSAASLTSSEGKGAIIVWRNATGQPCRRLEYTARTLCFSPDAAMLAAGGEDGSIVVWELTREEPIAHLRAAPTAIKCLSFGRDGDVTTDNYTHDAERRWQLVAGHAGGMIVVWDLNTRLPKTFCRGSPFDVDAVRLSPDGAILASGGRLEIRLWDVASGELLLRLDSSDYISAIAFSEDGRRLAAGSTENPGVRAWELANGRGIQTMRGLTSQVAAIRFSADGHYLAAIAQDWKIAAWDLQAGGTLLHVLDVPKGLVADNAAIAFSPDAHLLAFSSGNRACLWDARDARLLKEWTLGQGLVDVLAFPSNDAVLSFRVESTAQTDDSPHGTCRRACRMRRLNRGTPAIAFDKAIDESCTGVSAAGAPRDGNWIVVDECVAVPGERRMIRIFDANGREIHSVPSTRPAKVGGRIVCDTAGAQMAVALTPEPRATLFDLRTCLPVGELAALPYALNTRVGYWATAIPTSSNESALALYDTKNCRLVTFGIDSKLDSAAAAFSDDGQFLAWGGANGTVCVSDLHLVRERLQSLGLNWPD